MMIWQQCRTIKSDPNSLINFCNVVINRLTHWSHYYVILTKKKTKEEICFSCPFKHRSSISPALEKDMLKSALAVTLETGQEFMPCPNESRTDCPDSVHNELSSNRCRRLNKLCCMLYVFLSPLKIEITDIIQIKDQDLTAIIMFAFKSPLLLAWHSTQQTTICRPRVKEWM